LPLSFQRSKRQFTNGGEVESGVFLSRLAGVFAHDDIGHPMQVVLKAQIGAGSRQNGNGGRIGTKTKLVYARRPSPGRPM
jgi:hypothetical protein